jgi:hypothetical protein
MKTSDHRELHLVGMGRSESAVATRSADLANKYSRIFTLPTPLQHQHRRGDHRAAKPYPRTNLLIQHHR